jgi:hypothetical protein
VRDPPTRFAPPIRGVGSYGAPNGIERSKLHSYLDEIRVRNLIPTPKAFAAEGYLAITVWL